MSRLITYPEYKRRVFNKIICETFSRIQIAALTEDTDEAPDGEKLVQKAIEKQADHGILNGSGDMKPSERAAIENMVESYLNMPDVLNLHKATINETIERLKNADYFMFEAAQVAERIADAKAAEAKEDDIKLNDEDDVELSQEDKAVMDQLFELKGPQPQIQQIRDDTVKALIAEEQKANEIKDAIDVAKADVASGANPNALKETTDRLNRVGPTSFMNGLLNQFSSAAIKDINESGNFTSVRDAMALNRDHIKTNAVMVYSMFETANVMGIRKYSKKEIENMAKEAYYAK